MISRGIAPPTLSRRKPVSIGCVIMVLISTTSRFLALGGRTMRVAGMPFSSGIVDAGGLRNDHAGRTRPQRAVAHLGNDGDALRPRQADARHDFGASGARTEVKAHNVGDRVPLREHVDR